MYHNVHGSNMRVDCSALKFYARTEARSIHYKVRKKKEINLLWQHVDADSCSASSSKRWRSINSVSVIQQVGSNWQKKVKKATGSHVRSEKIPRSYKDMK